MTAPDPTPIAPETVADLKALLAKATPGPWESRVEPCRYPECDDVDLPVTISGAGKHIGWFHERYDDHLNQVNDTDASLIVLLRNNARALLAALDRAPADVAVKAEGRREGLEEAITKLCDRAAEYRKSIVGMRIGQAVFQERIAVELENEANKLRNALPAAPASENGL